MIRTMPMDGFLTHRAFGWLEGLGRIGLFAVEAAQSLFSRRVDWRGLSYQLYFIGVKSQSVVLVTGAFTGMVLCAQTYFQFHKVKMDTATLAVVSVAMGSELGPVKLKIGLDRKSTRLNSSHVRISYAVFCLKKKKTK